MGLSQSGVERGSNLNNCQLTVRRCDRSADSPEDREPPLYRRFRPAAWAGSSGPGRIRWHILMKTFALSGLLLLSIVLLGAADPQLWTPFQRPNSPIGEAKGVSPGRVPWSRDVRATPGDGKTGKWWEPANIDETVLSTMISKSLRALTGAPSDREAWDGLFRHFNRVHGRGDRGWQPGELVAVKINVNNT